ncbi:MAG TPA: hypothetical protein VN622_17250 [Clostridia bacterium]|nr:hypothetical protein [Clostridia bacterium]
MTSQSIPNATDTATPQSLSAMVGAIAATCCRERLRGLRSVLMIGSMGRGEATWERMSHGWRVLGDAEFVAVTDKSRHRPGEISKLCSAISTALEGVGIACVVDVSVVDTNWLRRLPKTIFTLEIRNASSVVYGSTIVLHEITRFRASEIDHEDAWRLLCNRLVEWLEPPVNSDQRSYRAVKLVLDCATSLLLLHGGYEPTYAARAPQLKFLAENDSREWPLPKDVFIDLVTRCTDFKLGRGAKPGSAELSNAPSFACAIARQAERTMSRDTRFAPRLRGWAFVARASGGLRSWRHWLRWGRMFVSGTPRVLVYSAAMDLIAAMNDGRCDEAEMRLIAKKLPVRSTNALSIENLSHDIAWNYHNFIEKTRA